MAWTDYKKQIVVGLWAAVFLLFAPSAYHLATYDLPESETIVCYPEYNSEYYGSAIYQESYDHLEEQFLARLADSSDPNAQLMSLLAATNGRLGAEEIDALAELSQRNPDNGFILVQLISACFEDVGHAACEDQRLSATIGQQPGNAAVWGELAMLRAHRNDTFGATRALQQAVAMPEFDDYFSLQIAVLDGAATSDDPWAKFNTVFRSFRYADSAIGHAIDYPPSSFCANEAGTNPAVEQACLEYGMYIAEQSNTNIGRMIGLSIQEVTHAAVGDSDGVAQIQTLLEEERQSRHTISRRSSSVVGLASYDASLAAYWVDNLIAVGESEALRLLNEEASQRLSDPAYRPCDPPGIRFEFPYFYYGDERVAW